MQDMYPDPVNRFAGKYRHQLVDNFYNHLERIAINEESKRLADEQRRRDEGSSNEIDYLDLLVKEIQADKGRESVISWLINLPKNIVRKVLGKLVGVALKEYK
jgi:hypothetical protein